MTAPARARDALSPTPDARRLALERELTTATRRRDSLLARATWWDRWRGVALLPLMVAGIGLGLVVGIALRHALRLPDKTEAFCAVLGLVLVGRATGRYFDVSKLTAAERHVATLRARARDAAD